MADLNVCVIEGRTTKDVDVRETANGKVIARFTLANDYGWGENKGTNFISCIAFGKTAEVIEKYVKKGDKASYHGSWRTGSYEKDGARIYTNDFLITEVSFQSRPNNITLEVKEVVDSPVPNGFEQIEEDIPF